ncbi:MAG TPA: hypothetical protein PLN33_19985 [Hyphomonadaceae bacterium]|nr:hypothetical protein [Hyphomonadaceae bacterium]
MCSYITLIVRGEVSGIPAALERRGRKASVIDNPSIRKVLTADETQFLTTAAHCDCGTVLGARVQEGGVRDIESEVRRLRKKGWSAAKIDRLLRDQQKAREKLGREPIDSFVFWADILNDVLALRGVNGAGLLVHQYSGSIADEHVSAQRREIRRGEIEVELPRMREDDLLFVQSR